MNKFYDLLPRQAYEKSSKLLLDEMSTIPSIGIVFSTLCASECSLDFITIGNEILNELDRIEILIFNMNRDLPIVTPRFAVYNAPEINTYFGTIIATDIPSWQISLSSPSKNKYLLLYDTAMASSIPPELIKKINDSGVKLIYRSAEYEKILNKIGYNSSGIHWEYITKKNILSLINHDKAPTN